LSHAYLFTGPPAIGKRTLALTLAQALLCQSDEPPCATCDPCRRVVRSQHPDLLLMDMATQARLLAEPQAQKPTLKIETIRILQREISLRPMQAERKVVIIPDAHLMTAPAANALLKTLEEPPAHVLLILTAPEADDLLPTIVSRCQLIPLHLIPISEIQQVLTGPPWQAEPSQANLLAHISGGRVGWAIRALQDPDLLSERKATLDLLQELLAGDDITRLDLADRLSREAGHSITTLALWSTWWRDLLLRQSGCAVGLTNVDRESELAAASQSWGTEKTRATLASLQSTITALEHNVNHRLAWEAFVLALPRQAATES
jgi:DNA polymerase-3 subunit delta'